MSFLIAFIYVKFKFNFFLLVDEQTSNSCLIKSNLKVSLLVCILIYLSEFLSK